MSKHSINHTTSNTADDATIRNRMRFTEAGCRAVFDIDFNRGESVYIDLARRLGFEVDSVLIHRLIFREVMAVCHRHERDVMAGRRPSPTERARRRSIIDSVLPGWTDE